MKTLLACLVAVMLIAAVTVQKVGQMRFEAGLEEARGTLLLVPKNDRVYEVVLVLKDSQGKYYSDYSGINDFKAGSRVAKGKNGSWKLVE